MNANLRRLLIELAYLSCWLRHFELTRLPKFKPPTKPVVGKMGPYKIRDDGREFWRD